MDDLPDELIGEIMMNMTIKEISRKSKTSAQWKRVANQLWCRLLNRDFGIKMNKDCDIKYNELNNIKEKIIITKDKIKAVKKKCKADITDETISEILTDFNFVQDRNGDFIYNPKLKEEIENRIEYMKRHIKYIKPNERDSMIFRPMATVNLLDYEYYPMYPDDDEDDNKECYIHIFIEKLLPKDFKLILVDSDPLDKYNAYQLDISRHLYREAYEFNSRKDFSQEVLNITKKYLAQVKKEIESGDRSEDEDIFSNIDQKLKNFLEYFY